MRGGTVLFSDSALARGLLLELAVTGFVFGDQLRQELIEPLGSERRQYDAMLQFDLHVLRRAFPVVIDAEVEHHFFACAGGVAEVGVAAFKLSDFQRTLTCCWAAARCCSLFSSGLLAMTVSRCCWHKGCEVARA